MAQLARRIAVTDLMLGMLAILSVTVLLLPQSWITRQHTLPLNELPSTAHDDGSLGGNSEARMIDGQDHAWRCELRPGFTDPFCSFQISLVGKDGNGVNLSGYERIGLDLKYTGSARSVRLYLRSRHPDYYVLGDLSSTKYNYVELDANELNKGGYSVSLSNFSVADWWVTSRKIPPELADTDFRDVLFIEIQTGADVSSGVHQFQLESMSWSGPIVSQKMLYRALIILWVMAIVALLIFRVVQLKLALRRNDQYQRQLMQVNKLLNLKNQQVEDLAKTDPLTGVPNRLGVREALHDGLVSWQRDGTALSMILLDIDDFKKLNDQHGHDVGDKALKAIAECLLSSIRTTDKVARWGGEEFMVICPHTDLPQARVVAENLRARLADITREGVPAITASFGVATMTRDDLDHLFKQADEALYAAKNGGKNRVMSAHLDGVAELAG